MRIYTKGKKTIERKRLGKKVLEKRKNALFTVSKKKKRELGSRSIIRLIIH